ncbi:XRE family transcriptional regulator [Lentibacillus cibarius]|uniref:XRE family transcriptional regulator n=1 Tax=Lentibacillus cibarius TaxID=2583219 RepID=A0A5S3QLJ1_9BACI|nr:XRE family transcriptional regulator [Lentibacillus cibarius]TMN22607.1 XRE family transcriptional regulator [Lentibacillus cibarius]
MQTILDKVYSNPSERPKYTRFELAKLVQERREELNMSIEMVASKYEVTESLWKSIEDASRVFNTKIYKLIGDFLNMGKNEMLAVEKDDITSLSFRTDDEEHPDIQETVQLANIIFDEMVMQEKIGSK